MSNQLRRYFGGCGWLGLENNPCLEIGFTYRHFPDVGVDPGTALALFISERELKAARFSCPQMRPAWRLPEMEFWFIV